MRGHNEPTEDGSAPSGVPDVGGDFFEQLVGVATDAVVTADADGNIVYANDAVESLLGYDPEAICGQQFTDFIPDRLRERYEEWHARYASGDAGTPLDDDTFEVTWLTADGDEKRLSASAFEHESDGRKLFTGIFREAPDLDEQGERLREEEALIEEIFDTSPIAVAVRDADGDLLRANQRAAELVGAGANTQEFPYDTEKHEASSEWKVYDTDGNRLTEEEFPVSRAVETGESVFNEAVVVERPDGSQVWLSVNAAPVHDGGEVERIVSTAEDITELKETQFELEHRREELETELAEVFRRVTDAFFALNDDWEFTYVNDTAEELLWRTEVELVGKNVWDEFPGAVDTTFQREYERAMETQEPVSFVEYYPPLSTWFEVRAYPSETGLSVYFQDVTERIQRERELERYETIVETVDDGIYIVGPDETFSMVNSTFAELVGYDQAELIGASPTVLYDDETANAARELQREILDGERESATLEHPLRTNGGETLPVETTFVVRKLGTEGHERVGVTRDITERKERQRELEAQNERLDAFASMLAHELRNPLEIAQIYLDMGVEDVTDGEDPAADEDAARSFREVEQALDRIEEMIDTLLVVTRRQGDVNGTEIVNLGEVAEEWWNTPDDRDGDLEVLTDREIRADPSRLRQLLENLFRNAEEHAGPGVTVRVGDLENGFYVEDDGPGIGEATRSKVFEPGYSTSNVGIGFGLAVVRQLVEAHGWECEIAESEAGGARFEFRGMDVVEDEE